MKNTGAADFERLLRLGITHILTVAEELQSPFPHVLTRF